MAPLIISIEGNIGSGKSTLLKNLQDKFQDRNYVFVKEPVDLWEHVTDDDGKTILENFYKEPTKYSFAFQMMAFTTRMSVLKKAVSENPDAEVIICERSIEADRHVFAQMLYDDKLMNKMEYKIYTDLAKEYIHDNKSKLFDPLKANKSIGLWKKLQDQSAIKKIQDTFPQQCIEY